MHKETLLSLLHTCCVVYSFVDLTLLGKDVCKLEMSLNAMM